MLTTADIRDWLKTFDSFEHYYIGKLDGKPDKVLGVYTLKQSGDPVRAIGQPSTYDIIGITLLIHWNKNAAETELAARTLYSSLYSAENVSINSHAVFMIELLEPEPVDVGTDDKGVYERVINLKIYYERN